MFKPLASWPFTNWIEKRTRSNRSRLFLASGTGILAAIAFTLASVAANDASSPRQKQSSTSQIASPQAPTGYRTPLSQYRLAGGFWRVDHTFAPVLIITNFLQNAELPVTPVLYAADGTEYGLPPVTLGPGGVSSVDITEALNSAPDEIKAHFSEYGSAGIKYLWHYAGAVSAMIQNRDAKRSLNFNFELHSPMTMQHSAATTVKEGLWWKEDSGVKGFLGLIDIAPHPIDLQVQVLSEQGLLDSQQEIQLQPKETRVLDLLGESRTASGGVRVIYAGTEKDVVLAGGLENPIEGYSAQIPFTVMQPSAKPSTVTVSSVGLMVGMPDRMMKFPSGTQFGVYAALRNTSERPILLRPTAYYMQENQVQIATLHTLALGPRQARHWDGNQFLKEAGLTNFSGMLNLVFSYEGGPSDLLMASGSIDQTKTYVFESVMKAVGQSNAKSLKAWDVSNGNDTMISLLNLADKDQDLLVTFFFDGGKYEYPIHLKASGSTTFNVSDIIMKQQPDIDGNEIPPDVGHGSAVLSGALGFTESINVGVNVGVFNVSTATCGTTCPTCFGYQLGAFQVRPYNSSTSTVPVGATATYVAWALGQDGLWHIVTTVGPYGNGTPGTVWTSDNGNVAAPQGPGRFNGVTPGTFNAIATTNLIDINADCVEGSHATCPTHPEGPASAGGLIQKPTSLKVLSVSVLPTGTTGDYGCRPGFDYGISVDITYQVLDQEQPQPQPIKDNTMVPHEHVVWSDGTVSDTNIGPTRISTTSLTTAADGTFHDAPVQLCSALPSTTDSNTQTITIISHGQTYTVRTQNMSFSATTLPGHGTVTNNLGDINKSR